MKLTIPQSETYKHRVALYGMGGVGKTQVATEYVFKYEAEYDSVFWISAATPADFQSGFQQIAKEVRCVNQGKEKDAEALRKAVLQWLKDNSSWLLVIDNLDDISVAHGYLPEISGENCHVLITTRNRDATGIPAQGLEIEVFDSNHAVDLLLLRAMGTKDCEAERRLQATKIVEELGYLALAIEHAAAFIRQSSLDILTFLEMYSKSRNDFLQNLPKQNHTYPRAVAPTLLMSFEKVKENNSEAAKLLILFTFLNPDGILVDFLQDGYEGLDEPLRTAIGNPFKFSQALADLGEFSLIRQSNDGQTIAVHRLVQAVIQDHIGPHVAKKVADSTTSLFLLAFPKFDNDKRQICRRYQAQVDEPLQRLWQFSTEGTAKISLRLGYFLDADGKASAGERFERLTVDFYTNIFGTDDSRTLTAMNNLAGTYRSLGQLKEAAELHEKVLDASQRTLGMEHPDTLTSMNNLAGTYRSLGQLKEAAELHQKVLDTSQRTLGMEHPNTLTSMNNLAGTYRSLGQLKEAAELHQKVLDARQRTLGMEHPDTLTSMNNLAETYRSLGQLKEAAELHQKVLDARQRTLGMEHPDTLTSMNNLAGTYWSLGQLKEAAELHQKVLDASQRTLGLEHPDTLTSMNNLAETYRSLGQLKEAAELHEKVLDASQRTLGMEHPNTLTSMNNLAGTYRSLGQLKEAAELHEKVLDARQRTLGMEHPDTLTSMNNFAGTYRSLGQLKEAAELHEKVLDARQRTLGMEHPNTLNSMYNLAATYWDLSRSEDAIHLFQAELTGCRKRYGAQHDYTICRFMNLIRKCREGGRLEEAARLEAEGLPMEEGIIS